MSLRHTVFTLPLLLFSALSAAADPLPLPLMPWPQQVEQPAAGGRLALTPQLQLRLFGDLPADADVRWRQRIERQTGWTLLPEASSTAPAITVRVAGKVAALPQLESDESYRLVVNGTGATLSASTRFGALRGMETLLQLIQNDSEGTFIPLVTITDRPRFPWRGVLIDSVRHFIPIDTLKRQIDGIAAARMNVFHWHLTDDQGWRFASTHYPQLQEKASDGLFYTQQQMREVVRYAADRGVRVVPELDIPGHASALAVAMPALIAAPGPYQMERGWGVFKPLLDPSNEAVYGVIDTLVGEMATIFPDPWLHIGGDEVDAQQWNDSPRIRQFMRDKGLADSHALQAWFNQRVEEILARHQRRMVGWDEIWHPDLPKSILIQSWQGQDALGAVAQQDYHGILSTGFYLDQPQFASYHYRNEVWPTALEGADRIAADEQAQSWQFTLPRLKGSAVTGSVTLVEGKAGWRGFIDFAGKSRRLVRQVNWLSPQTVSFQVDSWMGPLQPVLTLRQHQLTGYFLVGNVRYPVTGEQQDGVPPGRAPAVPDKTQLQANLKGGEAALWGENVNADVLDIKLWPRAFVVAERLWSAQNVTDEENMYQRLAAVDRWSAVSVGLQQHTQALTGMMRLANRVDVAPLQIFAQALEPAHYYTRQHLKFQAGHYTQAEPLNRLADLLPAESLAVKTLTQQVEALIGDRASQPAAQAIRQQLAQWRQNVPQVMPLLDASYPLKALRPVAEQVAMLSDMGSTLVNAWADGQRIDASTLGQMRERLDAAAQTQDELVIALVRPLDKLLRAVASEKR
ncbi:family 20 glycosylhydrolase [Mixta gaviniae]|uniref:beta-N-acetylhexosaminidase n=1 Tax=Mixta gaviniae TaxID=665914 RepID=A0A2L0IC75_9GAMM|nr:family 20 glycosylhydrolase [Mixta gaviniae]AUX92144.1 beta-N-acetylhexosaminidase [Mixta gaviniae]